MVELAHPLRRAQPHCLPRGVVGVVEPAKPRAVGFELVPDAVEPLLLRYYAPLGGAAEALEPLKVLKLVALLQAAQLKLEASLR